MRNKLGSGLVPPEEGVPQLCESQAVQESSSGGLCIFKNADKFNHDEWNALVQCTGGNEPQI